MEDNFNTEDLEQKNDLSEDKKQYATVKDATRAYVVMGKNFGGGLMYAKSIGFIIQNLICEKVDDVFLYSSLESEIDENTIFFFLEDPFGKMPYLNNDFYEKFGGKIFHFIENGGNVYTLSSMDFSINNIKDYRELMYYGYTDIQYDYINRLANLK